MDSGDERLNWEQIESLDIDSMTVQSDVNVLQKYFKALILHDMTQESCVNCENPLDTALVKGFRLAQLSMVYLYTCQEFLIADLQAAKKKMSEDAEMLDRTLEGQGGLHKTVDGVGHEFMMKNTEKKLEPQLACNRCPRCGLSCQDSAIYQCHCRHPDEDTTGNSSRHKVPPDNCSENEINYLREEIENLKQELKDKGSNSVRFQLENSILKEHIDFLKQRAGTHKSKSVRFLLPDGTVTESESNQRKRLMHSILKKTDTEKSASVGIKERWRRLTAKPKGYLDKHFTKPISTLTTWMKSRVRKKKKFKHWSQATPVFSASELSSRQNSQETAV